MYSSANELGEKPSSYVRIYIGKTYEISENQDFYTRFLFEIFHKILDWDEKRDCPGCSENQENMSLTRKPL